MSTSNKITFGNTLGTTYSINNPSNFAYTTGEYIQPSTSNYQDQSTTVYGGAISNYQPITQNRGVIYGGQLTNQSYTVPTTYSTVQAGNPTQFNYGATTDVSRPAPVTKITFGGKQFTETYARPQQYETVSTYSPPLTTYQTYQTYAQPTEIQTITSQPIREEVRYEQVVQPKQVEREEVVTASVPEPVRVDAKRKSKKAGCPAWIWYLLGVLLLIALIVGLIFLFKNLNVGGKPAPAIITNGTSTTGTTKVDNETTTTTTTNSQTASTTTKNTTGTTFVTPTVDTKPTNITTPITTGTTTVTPVDITPTVTPVDTTTVVTPTTTITDDSFIDPTAFAPTPVTSTSTYTIATPTTTYTTGTSSTWTSGSSGYVYPTSTDTSAPSSNIAIADPSSAWLTPTTAPINTWSSTDVQPTSVY